MEVREVRRPHRAAREHRRRDAVHEVSPPVALQVAHTARPTGEPDVGEARAGHQRGKGARPGEVGSGVGVDLGVGLHQPAHRRVRRRLGRELGSVTTSRPPGSSHEAAARASTSSRPGTWLSTNRAWTRSKRPGRKQSVAMSAVTTSRRGPASSRPVSTSTAWSPPSRHRCASHRDRSRAELEAPPVGRKVEGQQDLLGEAVHTGLDGHEATPFGGRVVAQHAGGVGTALRVRCHRGSTCSRAPRPTPDHHRPVV